jgi:protein-disulfide isomerase
MTFGRSDDDAASRVDAGLDENTGASREVAREKAKALRAQHRKRERRGRVLLRSGIFVAIVAVVAVVAVSIVQGIRPPSAGPLNMISDGIQIGDGLIATATPALQPDATPVPTVRSTDADAVAIVVYGDYQSADSGQFTAANNAQIRTWLSSKAATIEYHPISLLNSRSGNAMYSTRAANAVACAANYDPNHYFAYNAALLTKQPSETSSGLSNDQLVSRAKTAGVSTTDQFRDCVSTVRFKNWVKEATDRAVAGRLPNSNLHAISEPLTVLVNGVQYTGALGDSQLFAAFVVQAAGAQFNDQAAATATPAPVTATPTATPTPTSTPSPTATKKKK